MDIGSLKLQTRRSLNDGSSDIADLSVMTVLGEFHCRLGMEDRIGGFRWIGVV